MQRYQTSTPRTVIALAAVALTAATLGLSVIAPAHVDVNTAPSEAIIADAPTRVERIDVIAVRPAKVASMHGRVARHKQQES